MPEDIPLPPGKKVYFISDFHLGVPDRDSSLARELKIIRWLEMVKHDAAHIYIMGDIFDFWFEYRYTVPKGYVRLLGKLAELTDSGLPITFFTGNHDMWMFDYFTQELNIPIIRKPMSITIQSKKLMLGHGDGLGPGDWSYKFIKTIFTNRFFQWVFSISPPSLGIGIAQWWSRHSRISNKTVDEHFLGEKEWIYLFCKDEEAKQHHDYYIFGHRHMPLEMKVGNNARYINLGEWVNYYTYAEFDGDSLSLKYFEA